MDGSVGADFEDGAGEDEVRMSGSSCGGGQQVG